MQDCWHPPDGITIPGLIAYAEYVRMAIGICPDNNPDVTIGPCHGHGNPHARPETGVHMSFDLDQFSSKDLEALITQASKRKAALNKRKPAATVRKQITSMAKAEGYSVEELFGPAGPTSAAKRGRPAGKTASKVGKAGTRKGRKLGKVAPKYRNPANPKETWTGRGLAPRWMAALEAKGKKRDEFLIKK